MGLNNCISIWVGDLSRRSITRLLPVKSQVNTPLENGTGETRYITLCHE